MEKNISQTKVDNVKNVARLSISRADVKNIKVVDADIVIYLKTGKRIVLRDGVVKAMMDPDFSIGFVDGEISAQAALQQSGLVDLNPISTATVASAPEAEKTDESATSSTTVSQSASSAPTPTYAEAAAKSVMQAPTSAPEVVAQAKPAPEPSLLDTVRPYIGALGLLGLAAGGGGGGAAASSVSSATGTVVSGTLVLGPVESSNGLTVNLYKADGTWLGSSAVASGGAFSVTLSDKTYSGPIIAVVSDSSDGTDYVDEATGEAQDLGAKYMAIQTVTAGAAASLNINALTTVAAIHAGVPQEWDEGKSTLTKIITAADVTTHNTAVASMFGLSNVVTDTVSPIINSSGSYVASGNYYGQVLAAISGVDKINSDELGDTAKAQKQTISELVAQTAGGVMSSTGVTTIVKGAALASTEASTIAQKVDTSAAKTAAQYESAASLTALGGVNDLSISVIASLSATAVQKIVDVDRLSDQAFKAINFAYFSDTQVQTLTSTQVASLSKAQLAQMTPTQLTALGNNVIYLDEKTLASLSQSSSEKLTSAQLVALAEQGKLDNLSTQLTTSQVNGLAGSLSGSISDADTKLFNSILGDITNGGGVDSSTGVKDFTEAEKRIESALKIEEALAVVHQLNEIAALNPSSSTYAADLARLSEELTGADLQLIGLAGTNGAYTELQKNALLTKLAEGEVADITGIAYLKSLVDVVNPTLSASTLPTTSKTTIYHLAGDGIGETINLTITFSEKVNGLTSGTNSKIFLLEEVGIEATWSGVDGTSTRTLTYTIAANQNGKVTINENTLKDVLLKSITDVAGNALVYESVIAEIDSSTFARVDGVAPTLTLTPLTDTDLSLAQATSFEQSYLAVDNTNGLGIRTTSAVVENSAGEVQNGLTLTTTGGKVAGDLSSLAAGSYTLKVTTTDVAGNTDVKTQTFLIDKLAPSLELEVFTAPQTKLTSAEAAAYTQTYTSVDNEGGTGLASTVAVVKNASGVVQTGVTLSTAGGNVSGNLSSLADGRYTVEVTSTDVAGNAFVQTQELVIDKTPAVLNLTALTDDKLTNQQAKNYTQAYTATDALTDVATTVARVLNSNNEVQQGVVLTTDNGHVTGDLSGLADGQYTIEVTTTDQAGNTTVKTQTVVIDATNPTLNLAALSDTQLTSAEAAVYSQSFTVSDATSGVAATSAVVKNSSGVVQNVTLTTANNKVEGNLSTLAGDENYYVEVTTTDQAGNMTTVQSEYLYIDKTAPTATPLTISSIAKFANLNLGFSEPIVKGASGSIYICKLDGTVVETIAVSSSQVQVAGDGKLVTINPVNDLVVGTSYYARVDAGAFTDPSGNPMAAIGANEWNFNAVSVGTSLIIGGAGVNANEGFINADELSQMTLSGVITNAVNATGVAVTRVVFHATDNSGDIVISSSSLSGLLPVIGNDGRWQLSNDPVWTDQLVSGKTYTVSVDVGGVVDGVSVGSTASSASFVVDTLAPIISTTPLNAAENGTVVGSAVATDSSSLTWTLVGTGADDAKFNISSSGVLTLKAAKDYETPGSAAGTNAYVVKLKATDAAGNFSIQDVTVNVTNVNEAPVNTVPGAQTTAEETEKVITGLSIADVDAGAATNVTVILSVSNGTLNIAGGTAAITGNGTGSVTLTGSVAQINSTLAASNAVKYTPGLNFNGNATLTMTTNDGGSSGTGGALSDVDTVTIAVTAVNDKPVLTAGKAWTYTEQAAATVVDDTITLTDVDDTQITGATVTIGTGLTTDDVLNFATIGSISGTYNSGTGVLTLTGTATKAEYQAALRTVTYSNASEDPTVNGTKPSRTITWAVTDANSDGVGAQTSVGVTSTITLSAVNDKPVLTAGKAWTYTEQAAATVVDDTITLTDVDDTQITGATVTIGTGLTTDDVLNFATIGSISGTYNSGTGVLTLTGTATKAEYQAALRTVTYSNASDDPTATSASRTITWAVTDANSDGVGAQTSVGVTSTINVTAVNDVPTFTTTTSTTDYANTAGDQLLFSNTSVSAVESAQSIKSLKFTVSGVTGTNSDRVKVDGVYISLVDGTTGTTTTNSVGYSVGVVGGVATVTLTSAAGLSNTVAQGLVNGLAYNNAVTAAGGSAAGMDGHRVVTLVEITDSGSDNNVTSLNSISTLNDTTPPPTISSVALSADTGTADLVTQTANQTVTATLSRALASTERLEATLDGTNWTNITASVTGTNVSWSTTLANGANALTLRTVDAANQIVSSNTLNSTLLQTMAISAVVDDNGTNTLSNTVAQGASTYRYVYLSYNPTTSGWPNLGELIVMSNGVNIAAGKIATTNLGQYSTGEGIANLTDGNIANPWTSLNSSNSSGWLQLDLGAAYHIDSTAIAGAPYGNTRAQGFTTWLSNSSLSGTSLANLPAAGAVQIQTTTPAFSSSDPLQVGRLVSTDDTTPTFSGTLSAALPSGYKVQIFNNGTYLADATVSSSNGNVTWNYTFAPNQAVYGTNSVVAKVVDGASATYLSSNYSFELNTNTVNIGGMSESGMAGGNTDTLAQKYRYVYIRIDDWQRNNTDFAELQVFSNGVNVALNKTVTSAINASTYNVASLVDGSTGTRLTADYSWYDGGAARNGWIKVDLGSDYRIDAVFLYGSGSTTSYAQAATVWVSSANLTASSQSTLSSGGALQVIGTTGAFGSGTAMTGYMPTDDTTPTIYGTLATSLGTGYKLGIYDSSTYLGDATVNADRTWTYTVGTAMSSGSLHSLSARIYQGYTTNTLVTSAAVSTNIFFKISPIVLDLNHDGQINYSSVLMDVTGAGVISKVTWAAPEDGVLVWNKYGDGLVHDKSQYAFGDPSKGITDLQGLAQNFDTNQDGVFNASDEKFSQFMVWQDQNGDGISQADEVKSLVDTGVSSLNLTSDGVKSSPIAGVEEAGRTTATQNDGQSMLMVDATFSYTKASVLQGVDASKDTFTISNTLTQINAFSDNDGDVIDLSGLLSQLHATNGNVADYVQTVQRGNHTVIQVDATGQHDFVNASNQVVLMNTTTTLALLQQQNHVVI